MRSSRPEKLTNYLLMPRTWDDKSKFMVQAGLFAKSLPVSKKPSADSRPRTKTSGGRNQ